MTSLRLRSERGPLTPAGVEYGRSALGAPLLWFPASHSTPETGLILAGTHGDETAAVVALSCALRSLLPEQQRHHVILAANPDGCQLGLRANANGVDLNRNFPTENWKPGETHYRWNSYATERDVVLSSGSAPGSEPETQALCALIETLAPRWVVSLHEPLACIEDPDSTALAEWLSHALTCRWSPASATRRPALSATGVLNAPCPASRWSCRPSPPTRRASVTSRR